MKSRAGYSLFEVLIAFVIMSLVLAALIPGQARLLGRATTLDQKLLAHDYAISRIALMGVEGPLESGTRQDMYREWDITTQIVDGATMEGVGQTLIISVTIVDRQGHRLATVKSLKVMP